MKKSTMLYLGLIAVVSVILFFLSAGNHSSKGGADVGDWIGPVLFAFGIVTDGFAIYNWLTLDKYDQDRYINKNGWKNIALVFSAALIVSAVAMKIFA